MALPTYGLLGAGSAMLQAPPGQGLGQTIGQGLSGFLSGMPTDLVQQQQARRRKTLEDVRQAWLAGAEPLAQQHAIPISYLSGVSKAESNDQNIPQQINDTGSAFGPFQFTSGTWNDQIAKHPELGLTPQDRFNPAAQGRVAVTFTRDNRDALRGALNREPSAGELFLAHRFGAQGAIALLNTPRNQSVAKALPAAVAANPQWAGMTVGQILDNSAKQVGSGVAAAPRGGGGLLGSSPTPSTGGSTEGLAALFGGMPMAPAGTALNNMTPEFRNILSIALQDPSLGPAALDTILKVGLSGGSGGAGALKPTNEIINAIASNYPPGSPEWNRVVGKEPQPEGEKPTDIMKEAKALYPDDLAAQANYIKSYREKTTGVTVQNIPQALPVNKAVADKFEGDIANGDVARSALGRIEAAKMALQQINTGAGAGVVANIGSYLRSAGIDPSILGIPDIASPAEAINAITAPMILELRGVGKGGEGGMPGNLSDNDLRFLKSSTIGIEKQPGANAAILMVQERLQQRRLELEQLAADHAQTNNGQVAGSYINERLRYIKSHPLFDDAFKKEFKSVLEAPGVSVTAPPPAAAAAPKAAAPTLTPVPPGTPATPGGDASTAGPPLITDQKGYDALAPGAAFTYKDSKGNLQLGRKP